MVIIKKIFLILFTLSILVPYNNKVISRQNITEIADGTEYSVFLIEVQHVTGYDYVIKESYNNYDEIDFQGMIISNQIIFEGNYDGVIFADWDYFDNEFLIICEIEDSFEVDGEQVCRVNGINWFILDKISRHSYIPKLPDSYTVIWDELCLKF